ncbi:MAG TPA: VOC family protein [Methylocystis sp.]|nr:VOC family protein [Methylocystis sp.]
MGRRSVSAVIYAKDVERLAHFYETMLGLVREEEGPAFIALARDAVDLVIVQIPAHIGGAITISEPPRAREDGAVKLSFEVEDIEVARRTVGEVGGWLQPSEAAWGWRGLLHLNAVDPEGNVFQLRQADRN